MSDDPLVLLEAYNEACAAVASVERMLLLGMLPDLARWQATLAERITIALLSTGGVRGNRMARERHGLENVLVQDGGEVFEAYRATATPSMVIVTPDGRIASATHSSRAVVEALIRSALHNNPVPVLRVVRANGDG